jgi:hypothetical protein
MKNPRTSQEAVQYVFNSHKSELIKYYPAEFKIARENRYVLENLHDSSKCSM